MSNDTRWIISETCDYVIPEPPSVHLGCLFLLFSIAFNVLELRLRHLCFIGIGLLDGVNLG